VIVRISAALAISKYRNGLNHRPRYKDGCRCYSITPVLTADELQWPCTETSVNTS